MLLSCFLFFLECLPITSVLACLNIFYLRKREFSLKIYLSHILNDVCVVGLHVYMDAGAHGDKKMVSDSPGAKVTMVYSTCAQKRT